MPKIIEKLLNYLFPVQEPANHEIREWHNAIRVANEREWIERTWKGRQRNEPS